MALDQKPIALAIAAVVDQRGMTSADLVRDMQRRYGVPPGTMRNIIENKVRIPGRDIRTALDAEFAPGLPTGTTLRVARGDEPGYPPDPLVELAQLARPLPDEALMHLVGFLRELAS